MTAPTPQGSPSATQRARMQMRLVRDARRKTVPDIDDYEPKEIELRRGAGAVNPDDVIGQTGTLFDWRETLYIDSETHAVYDGGDQRVRDYAEMFRSYHKARMLQIVLSGPIKGAGWKLKPRKGDTGEAEETEERLRRPSNSGGMSTPIQTVIGQMTTAFWNTKAYFVKELKLDRQSNDGAVMFAQLAMRPASTCRVRREFNGDFLGFEQDVALYGPRMSSKWSGKPVGFEARRAMVYIHGVDQEPISGVSDLEIAYWCWRTQQKLIFLWYNFLEAQALPRTLVKHQGDELAAKAAAQAIARTKSTGVTYFDGNNIEVDTLDTSGKGPQSFVEAVRYLDTCASGSALAGFTDLTTMASGNGHSLALSSDQSDFFLQTRIHAANEVAACLENYAVADLVRLNRGRDAVIPEWVFDPLAGVDDKPVLELLQAVAAAAQTGLPAEFVRELAIESARILHLDVDKIEAALEKAAADAQKQAAQMGAPPGPGQDAAAMNGAMNKAVGIAKQVAGQQQGAGGGGGTAPKQTIHVHMGGTGPAPRP